MGHPITENVALPTPTQAGASGEDFEEDTEQGEMQKDAQGGQGEGWKQNDANCGMMARSKRTGPLLPLIARAPSRIAEGGLVPRQCFVLCSTTLSTTPRYAGTRLMS
jgi:hypothetical protein